MYRYICSVVSFASMKILMHACSTMAKRKFVPHGFHTPDNLASTPKMLVPTVACMIQMFMHDQPPLLRRWWSREECTSRIEIKSPGNYYRHVHDHLLQLTIGDLKQYHM